MAGNLPTGQEDAGGRKGGCFVLGLVEKGEITEKLGMGQAGRSRQRIAHHLPGPGFHKLLGLAKPILPLRGVGQGRPKGDRGSTLAGILQIKVSFLGVVKMGQYRQGIQ
jgi:hypothetical protein